MSPPPRRDRELLFALALLALVGVLVDRAVHRLDQEGEQAAVERARRLELEERLKSRDSSLDGALDTISQLKDRLDQLPARPE